MLDQNLGKTLIGMSDIKKRRLEELEVECHQGTKVGDYVPFYFCPRSIMLYVLHQGNAPGLTYTKGQRPIVHLEADLHEVIQWASQQGTQWAFTTSNAGAYYCNFYQRVADLDQVDWSAVAATDFRASRIKEGKQAEFLLHSSFPWSLVRRIGVKDLGIAAQTQRNIQQASHQPVIETQPDWYF